MIRTQKYTITIILLVAFASLANSKLEVTNLDQMNPSLIDDDLKDIPYSIANFGFAPYLKFDADLVKLWLGIWKKHLV